MEGRVRQIPVQDAGRVPDTVIAPIHSVLAEDDDIVGVIGFQIAFHVVAAAALEMVVQNLFGCSHG
jgi:hypothetical protein